MKDKKLGVNDELVLEQIEAIGDAHVGTSINTPMKKGAFDLSDDKKIEVIEIVDDEAKATLKFHIKTEKLPKNLDHTIHCDLTYKKIDGDWKVSGVVLK
mgnify:CR=1 FL=1